ncbi:hypothetical protein [Sulfurimonas sp.]|uniref:hypothetical protein n=1 Tax=Sulfurimonas sp. TaxID=2022749 RepID=UPI0035679ABE
MINLVSSKKVDLILPNMNKALKEVLKDATPKQLESISSGKDLRSIMDGILKQSSIDNSNDKTLLNLVKNNPTLKSLGDVSTTIKDLLNTIKNDKNPLEIEKVLKNVLVDIKDVKDAQLKQKFESSGVFLESRLKDVKSPQVELKNILNNLQSTLAKSEFSSSQSILKDIRSILSAHLQEQTAATKDIPQVKELALKQDLPLIAQKLKKIIVDLKSAQTLAEPIHKPSVESAINRLEHLTSKNLLQNVEDFKYPQIKDALENISMNLSRSFTLETKGIMDALNKIFAALKSVEQNVTNSKAMLDNFLSKGIDQDINKMTSNLKDLILKSDPIFSKDINSAIHKLQTFTNPQNLHPQQNVKDILTNDFKALLSQAADEISKSNHPNKNELLNHIDKLGLQIDNFQLVSHLSNASSLYLPFSWDGMQEGSIEMKKAEDRFYCDIDLKLKDYGELMFKLTLYEKNQLNLHIYTTSKEFQSIVKENLSELRSAIIDVNVTPREIRIFEPKETNATMAYNDPNGSLVSGFEVKA